MQSQVITIQSTSFTAPAPFSAGHVLTDVEANVLNQTFAENLRNNFAARMKRRQEENEELKKSGKPTLPDLSQSDFDTYAAEYRFGVKATRTSVDPVMAQARLLAESALRKRLKAKGIQIKSIPEENWDKLIEEILTKYPQLTEQAKKIVETKRLAGEAIADIEV